MQKTIVIALVLILFHFSIRAQINLVGAAANLSSGKIDIVKWQALDSQSVSVFPSILDGYYFATSSFDSYNSNYYLTGISGTLSGLYSFNTLTNEESLTVASLYTNINEFDMSTGKMYNLKMLTANYINVYEFDINKNQDSLIGTIYEPGVDGIVADAITFDSNNGILYYVGFTNDPSLCLYAISVRNSLLSCTKTILNLTGPYNNIFGVEFDNVNERIYALNSTYDSSFNFTGTRVVDIDRISGNIVNRGELAGFDGFVGGSSCFDQNTGTYMVVGISTGNESEMIAFNTVDNTFISGFVPGNVSEIECDNAAFAMNRYVVTLAKPQQEAGIRLYPNPVVSVMEIESPFSGAVNVQVVSSSGKLVLDQHFNSGNKMELNLGPLSPGIYALKLISGSATVSEKILVR